MNMKPPSGQHSGRPPRNGEAAGPPLPRPSDTSGPSHAQLLCSPPHPVPQGIYACGFWLMFSQPPPFLCLYIPPGLLRNHLFQRVFSDPADLRNLVCLLFVFWWT